MLFRSSSYLRCSCSRVSTWAGFTGMHSTGQTCTHWGSPKCPTHSVQRAGSGCGVRGVWRWKEWAFAMEEMRQAGDCVEGHDSTTWPRIWPTEKN